MQEQALRSSEGVAPHVKRSYDGVSIILSLVYVPQNEVAVIESLRIIVPNFPSIHWQRFCGENMEIIQRLDIMPEAMIVK
jgi:hypothetical protein